MNELIEMVEVRCWGKRVGALARSPRTGYYAFEYSDEFRETAIELAPLTAPLRIRGAITFSDLPQSTYYRLPPFIADSLPDDFGKSLVNIELLKRGISPDSITALDRLSYVGRRGMGALEYRPVLHNESDQPVVLEIRQLAEEARKAMRADFGKSTTSDLDAELAQIIMVGTSAGGARAKAVVGFDPTHDQFVSGQFEIPPGYEHWLIKFDTATDRTSGKRQEYGRIEYAYYLMARECGIVMSDSRLYEKAGRAHFMTKRFDREDDNRRHHVQTLNAMAQLDYNALRVHDYLQLFDTIRRLDLPYAAHDEQFRRMVFNVAMVNRDDHTKNHGFLLKEGGAWELAPAYDMTYAHGAEWTVQHVIGIDGVFDNVNRDDVMRVARRFHVMDPTGIIDRILQVASRWNEFAEAAGLSKTERERVGADIARYSRLLRN